jgi:hypothetical protein
MQKLSPAAAFLVMAFLVVPAILLVAWCWWAKCPLPHLLGALRVTIKGLHTINSNHCFGLMSRRHFQGGLLISVLSITRPFFREVEFPSLCCSDLGSFVLLEEF